MSVKLLNLVLLLQIKLLVAQVLVRLPTGEIKGREAKTFANRTYYAFEGIPYAAQPIGNLRFKPPQPVSNWDGILDTSSSSKICFQTSGDDGRETEDCLYLSVYTPQLPNKTSNGSLPVMLYIHGGGFIDGSGNYSPDLYVNKDVILVTINYRLGIFGFISTEDQVIPGNNGLKDQRFAIQWTHDNIGLFGGDPQRVTIFGESAGSASCAYQLLNQDSKELFQAAILQSGSFLSPWTYQRRARQIAFGTAARLNSTFESNNDSKALLDFFLTLDARTLDATAQKYRASNLGPQNIEIAQGFFWAPIVEVNNSDAFLTERMYVQLKKGNVIKVPILVGITSEENLSFNSDANGFKNLIENYDQHLDWLVPDDMKITDSKNRTEMGRKIRELYTRGESLSKHLEDAMTYCSDTSFGRSVIKHAEIYSKLAPTYFYIFSYNRHSEDTGKVGHAEDLFFLFCGGSDCDESRLTEATRLTRQRLIKLWTDFAKYKNPTPKSDDLLESLIWPRVATCDGNFFYLDIGKNLAIRNRPKERTYEGWNELYESLGYDDFDSY